VPDRFGRGSARKGGSDAGVGLARVSRHGGAGRASSRRVSDVIFGVQVQEEMDSSRVCVLKGMLVRE
jgi:hypothetical protein